jgi:uncharacterized protein (TIRG00374 family)
MAKFKLKNFSAETLKKSERKVISFVAFLIAVGGILAFIFGGERVLEPLKRVPIHGLWVLALASLIENVLRIYRYRIFANALKLPVPWGRLVLYYVAGMALLPTPGKIGVVLRLWLLHLHHNIPYRRSSPLLVMDVLTDTIAMLALIAIGILSLGHVYGAALGLVLLTGLTVGIVIVLAAPKFSVAMLKLLYRLSGKRAPRFFAGIKRLLVLLGDLMGWRVLVGGALLSFLAWASFGFAMSYLIIAMGTPVDWNLGAFALSIGTILGVVSMAPAGVGGAEAGMTAILHHFGTPLGTAFIVTMLARLAIIWLPVAVGFIALPWALATPKKHMVTLAESNIEDIHPEQPQPKKAKAKKKAKR